MRLALPIPKAPLNNHIFVALSCSLLSSHRSHKSLLSQLVIWLWALFNKKPSQRCKWPYNASHQMRIANKSYQGYLNSQLYCIHRWLMFSLAVVTLESACCHASPGARPTCDWEPSGHLWALGTLEEYKGLWGWGVRWGPITIIPLMIFKAKYCIKLLWVTYWVRRLELIKQFLLKHLWWQSTDVCAGRVSSPDSIFAGFTGSRLSPDIPPVHCSVGGQTNNLIIPFINLRGSPFPFYNSQVISNQFDLSCSAIAIISGNLAKMFDIL